MKSLWDESKASSYSADGCLGLRVYTSQLLGQNTDLVMHGGGNTSIKDTHTTVFAEQVDALFVKGSGWDLKTIEAAGFPAVGLDYLKRLGELELLSDSDMMKQLRLALLDPSAPTPSVEAILHALIPHKVVDHSHADAVVAISNTPSGESILRELYGPEVLVLPYIMPGFILAKQVADATRGIDWSGLRGIVLLHHGIFTFHEDAKTSYETMIELVSKAEDYLIESGAFDAAAKADYQATDDDLLVLAALRKSASTGYGAPLLLRFDNSEHASGFAQLNGCTELIGRGPLTPDHTIHAKPFGAVFSQDPQQGLASFARDYQEYFHNHRCDIHQCLDDVPRYGVWQNKGLVYFAPNLKRLGIVEDITEHTVKAIQWGESLGGWQVLSRQDLFDVEYWELEQAKLKTSVTRLAFEGKVAIVTGAASGIGYACVKQLQASGAVVAALDLDWADSPLAPNPAVCTINCDVTDRAAVKAALAQVVQRFGGIDILVSNAGIFPASQNLSDIDDDNWQKSIDVNLSAHMSLLRAALPYLKLGIDPAVVIVGSKNVPAPGPGAAAYSVAKAGLAQLARIAALELGPSGIRVNTVHPNAVYDTGIWTDEVLSARADHYGISVDEYKTNNVLGTELRSIDVAKAVCLFAGTELSKTTGAQLPVDGGNDRVI